MVSKLPNELLHAIADLLEENDLNSFAQANSRLFSACNPVLYRKNMIESDGWALIWAIINRQNQTVTYALDTGATIMGEALAFAIEDGQEQVVERLLSVNIASKCTAASSKCIEQLKARQQWERHGMLDNRSPLSRAARKGHLGIVKLLIESNAGDPSVEDLDGKTPLFQAVKGGFLDIAKALFNTGKCDLNKSDNNFKTVLSYAAAGWSMGEMVQWLVSFGDAIILNHQDRWGQTALHYAAMHEDVSIPKLLIESGRVDPDIEDREMQTPLQLATRRSKELNMKLLAEPRTVDPEFRVNNDIAELYWLTLDCHVSQSILFIESCKVYNNYSVTEHSHASLLEPLSDLSRLDPDISEEQGRWMLSQAIQNSDTATLKTLICSGKVHLDWTDDEGRTPISRAAKQSDLSVMKLLIDSARVNLDSKDMNGRTPLSYAAEYSDASTVKLFIDSGKVDVDFKDNQGRTPLSYAVQHMDLSNLTRLVMLWCQVDLEPGLNPNNLVPRRSLAHFSTLKTLIDCGKADPNSRDNRGQTPLSYAAECSDSATIRLLLESPLVDVDSKSNAGRTPFFEAVASGNLAAAEVLLNSKMVNPNPRDNNGDAPIFEFFDLYSYLDTINDDQMMDVIIDEIVKTGYNRLLKLLLSRSEVDFNFRDPRGQTPLLCAYEECGYDVARLMIESGRVDFTELYAQHFPDRFTS
ncbi:ankyrin repeat-containing protein [Aspergillus arachidicola]|uniref:Ankyrin repeat-containing protein n=1 Tax=Aspergillus arachidicola TaxID=656916 RepID=A0A2G7FIL3_9EURO|nr:ankyrin repeat-containing protein [Aspergillus arachidicola]